MLDDYLDDFNRLESRTCIFYNQLKSLTFWYPVIAYIIDETVTVRAFSVFQQFFRCQR